MTRRLTLLPLLAALLLFGCKKGAETAAPGAGVTPTPPINPATGGVSNLPGENAGAPGPAGVPGAPNAPSGSGNMAESQGPPFDVSKLPAVVARVNGTDIRREDLLQRAQGMRDQMQQMGAPPPPTTEEFYREMVNQLVGSRLLLAEAKRKGYAPSPGEVQARVAQLKARFPDEATYKRQIAAQGMDEQQVANDLMANLAIQKLVTTEVMPAIKVTEQQERAFYQQNLEHMQRPPQVQVRHVLVAVPPNATPQQKQEAKQKAQVLLGRIKQGEDFAAVATEASDDPGSKGKGGLLPWMGRGDTVPPFEKAAFALKSGETSGVVETPFGFHILRLEGTRAASAVPFEEARPRIEQMLQQRRTRELLEQKVAGLRKSAKVDVLF